MAGKTLKKRDRALLGLLGAVAEERRLLMAQNTTIGSPASPGRDAAGTPISGLALLSETLGDRDRTANAKELLITAGKVAARIVLSLGTLLVGAALVGILSRSPISGPAIGGFVTIGVTSLLWGGHPALQAHPIRADRHWS